MTTQKQPTELLARWQQLMNAEPGLRARNAAARLGVSEGELVAARCGDEVIRLTNDYKALLAALVSVGQVLTITRNDYAVHEKRGYYSNLQLKEHGGGVFDYNINLRIFFRNWGHAFAVTDHGPHGQRKSLQIFDRDGTSVHKIYRTDNGDADAWEKLIGQFRAADQSPGMIPTAINQPYIPQSPDNVDVAALCKQWRAITDIHEFWPMLRDHKLRRVDALRLADQDLARPVAADAWRGLLQQAAKSGLPIMVFTRSPGVAQIHTGPVHKLVETNGWFNVLDPTFNLHMRSDAVSEAWVVYRPTASGGQTSLELYHENGQLISHMFGAVNLQAPELRGWRRLLAAIPTVDATLAQV